MIEREATVRIYSEILGEPLGRAKVARAGWCGWPPRLLRGARSTLQGKNYTPSCPSQRP